jgi:hypothetical protein
LPGTRPRNSVLFGGCFFAWDLPCSSLGPPSTSSFFRIVVGGPPSGVARSSHPARFSQSRRGRRPPPANLAVPALCDRGGRSARAEHAVARRYYARARSNVSTSPERSTPHSILTRFASKRFRNALHAAQVQGLSSRARHAGRRRHVFVREQVHPLAAWK